MENKPIGYKINQTSQLFKKTVSNIAQRYGMNKTYFEILHFLRRNIFNEITQSDICDFSHFKPSTISITLQNMQNDGLIVRTKSQADCRRTIVSLTEAGKQKCEETRSIFKITDKLLEDELDSNELLLFNQILDKLIKRMEDELIND